MRDAAEPPSPPIAAFPQWEHAALSTWIPYEYCSRDPGYMGFSSKMMARRSRYGPLCQCDVVDVRRGDAGENHGSYGRGQRAREACELHSKTAGM